MPKQEKEVNEKIKTEKQKETKKAKKTVSNETTSKKSTSSKPEKDLKIKKEVVSESKVEKELKKQLSIEAKSHEKRDSLESDPISSKKEFKTLEVIVLVLLTCCISLVVGGALGIRFHNKKGILGNVQVADSEIQQFIKDYNYLVDNYYGDLNKKELLNTAFKSMVDSLEDTYSGSLDGVSNNFNIELDGIYEGLGIEIINDEDDNIIVYDIIPNSPASKIDIQKKDRLITVNDVAVSGMKTSDFIHEVVNSAVDFTIVLERNGERKTVTLKKEKITLQSVISKTIEEDGKKIGYLKIEIFAANTYSQFKQELQKLEKSGMDSLIIDVRDNSGGHLTVVKDMISLFLDSSHVIYQTQTKSNKTKVYSTGKETKKYPIAIIGNSLSASASEVLIGALTEEYDAILVGNQTFGKGTVQELHTLSSGDEYKFTTKKWLTPKGKWVHNDGIKPSVEVTLTKDYYSDPSDKNDNQLQAALDYLKKRR